jgi:predicted dienelactone hydrolase
MRIVVWYPAKETEGAEPYLFTNGVRGAAVSNAAGDRSSSPYPLIIFSAGLLGGADAAVFFTQNLASYGYIVVSLDHLNARQHLSMLRNIRLANFGKHLPQVLAKWAQGDSSDVLPFLFEEHFSSTRFGLDYRPQEISFAIDQVVGWNMDVSSSLYGMVDSENLGIAGHSLGGFISILLAGMPFDPRDLDLILHTRLERPSNGRDRFEFADKRVKAVLALAPPIFHKDIPESARSLETPIMIMIGDSRCWEASFVKEWELYENAAGPRYLVLIKQTDHFVINDAILALGKGRYLFPRSARHNFMEKAQVYKDYSAAFFNLYLKGDEEKAGVLGVSSHSYVENMWSDIQSLQ